jgi:cyclopropane-fatty-acyl-phospholipid synthase
MTVENSCIAKQSVASPRRSYAPSLLQNLLARIVEGFTSGQLVVETPDRDRLVLHGRHPDQSAHLAIHHPRLLWRLLTSGDVGFAESYMAGEWSTPDLHALLRLTGESCADDVGYRISPARIVRQIRHALKRNTRRGSRRNVAAHYDLGNAFYESWLDSAMTYSSGLFTAPDQTLEQAQDAKLDRIVELLQLSGGERILEIGCGWGSLARRLLERHDCEVLGLTLSAQQLAFAQQRLPAALSHRCELRLQDYRDVAGTFDRIVSIEMLEAVGEAYWPTFFAQVRDRLRPGGVAVLQVISIAESRFAGYRQRPDFIQRYIFPGGMLPTPSIIEREATCAGLQLVGTEFFGASYARTLAEWQRRFEAAWPAIKSLGFDDRFKRMWAYYLAYCRVGFETGAVDVGFYKLTRPLR